MCFCHVLMVILFVGAVATFLCARRPRTRVDALKIDLEEVSETDLP